MSESECGCTSHRESIQFSSAGNGVNQRYPEPVAGFGKLLPQPFHLHCLLQIFSHGSLVSKCVPAFMFRIKPAASESPAVARKEKMNRTHLETHCNMHDAFIYIFVQFLNCECIVIWVWREDQRVQILPCLKLEVIQSIWFLLLKLARFGVECHKFHVDDT